MDPTSSQNDFGRELLDTLNDLKQIIDKIVGFLLCIKRFGVEENVQSYKESASHFKEGFLATVIIHFGGLWLAVVSFSSNEAVKDFHIELFKPVSCHKGRGIQDYISPSSYEVEVAKSKVAK